MRRQGVEDIKGKHRSATNLRKFGVGESKAELREQAEAAFRTWRETQTAKEKQRAASWLGHASLLSREKAQ
jgi:hypothetical protein